MFDARNHQPRSADLTDARLQDGLHKAAAAYRERSERLQDAWRGPGDPPPPALKDGQSPRDQYIDRITNAWRTPIGQAPDNGNGDGNGGDNFARSSPDADNIERARQSWISPGAKPGGGFGDARVLRETKDAAAARDEAYALYLDRLTNGWRK